MICFSTEAATPIEHTQALNLVTPHRKGCIFTSPPTRKNAGTHGNLLLFTILPMRP